MRVMFRVRAAVELPWGRVDFDVYKPSAQSIG